LTGLKYSGWSGGHRGGHHDHFGAEGAQQLDLLARHLVGDREDAPVALDRCGDREPDAGVPARPLDDRAAGLQRAAPLRGFDDGEADAVLHRAARVHLFGLREDRRPDAARDAVQPDQRGLADGLEDAVQGPGTRGHGAGAAAGAPFLRKTTGW
jgi:hypothetical protein